MSLNTAEVCARLWRKQSFGQCLEGKAGDLDAMLPPPVFQSLQNVPPLPPTATRPPPRPRRFLVLASGITELDEGGLLALRALETEKYSWKRRNRCPGYQAV